MEELETEKQRNLLFNNVQSNRYTHRTCRTPFWDDVSSVRSFFQAATLCFVRENISEMYHPTRNGVLNKEIYGACPGINSLAN